MATKATNREISSSEREEALWENVYGVAEALDLSTAELIILLKTPKSTFNRWRKEERIPESDLLRLEVIANFLRIGFNLEAMFTSADDRRKWLRQPHASFADQAPLAMLKESIESLIQVRAYLDYVRGLGA